MAYADGHLISITDGSNRSVTFTWANNRLSEARSAAGNPARVITYQYNSAGCLASVKNAGGYTTSYTYGPGRLMTAMTDWNGNTVNIAYNGNRAVSKLLSCQSEKASVTMPVSARPTSSRRMVTRTLLPLMSLMQKAG
ncbi:RHS repeat domain-containing protein [Paraflavitalea speifideaquila]|uniref:RHS repeat domain-containing protein n=1 Tax=Paraflavitalea speifideaquila TaxID=3076558 RepID=UPI0028EA5A08|nr:RHS repeat domain-containing protein [Paraflavitalea speifideiaquila]